MLFRAPGKTNNFEYSNNVHFQPVNEINQRSVCSYNNSFTVGQKCSSQEKVNRNCDQRFFNFQNPSFVAKTEPPLIYDDERFKQTLAFKSPTHTELGRSGVVRQNNNPVPLEHQCLILRKEKSQLSQKVKRAQQQLQNRDNLLRGKQREIEELKMVHTQSQNSKTQNDMVSELRSEKQKLYFQVIELQTEIHKMQQKYQKMQKEHYGLAQKYDELSNKSAMEINRKISREELLQSELSLSEKRNQRIKSEYEKQLMNLKEKIREMENDSKVYNNKSTVVSYNQSSFLEGYNSFKSQPDLESSRLEVEKYQSEIKQKNEMIRYLEMQCLKDKKKEAESDNSRASTMHDECKKQLTKSIKEADSMRKEISTLMSKVASSDKMREQLIKQVRDLEYLLKELRDKLCKTMEENRTINKRERENNDKLGEKIQQLESQLLRSSSKFRQSVEETQRTYEKLLSEAREKSSSEMIAKDEQLKLYSIEKQELLAKVSEYQILLKESSQVSSQYEQIKMKYKQLMEEKQTLESKTAEDLDYNSQRLQKQLKIKVQELFAADSKMIVLEKEFHSTKKTLEAKVNELAITVARFEEEKKRMQSENKKILEQRKRLEEEKRKADRQNEQLKSTQEERVNKETLRCQELQTQLESIRSKSQKEEERLENQIQSLKIEERKLRNMIADRERDNLNLIISVQNEKLKHNEASQKLKVFKEERKELKKQIEDLNLKCGQFEHQLRAREQSKLEQSEQIKNLKKEIGDLKSIILSKEELTNKNQREAEALVVKLRMEIECLKSSLKTNQEMITGKEQKILLIENITKNQQEKLFQLESELAEERNKVDSLMKTNKETVKSHQEIKAILLGKQGLIIELQQKLKSVSMEIEAKTQESNDEGLKVQQLTKKLEESEEKALKLMALLKDQSNKTGKIEIQMKGLKQKMESNKLSFEASLKEFQVQRAAQLVESTELKNTIESLKAIIKQRESIEDEQRKSLDQKDRYSREIELQLQELTIELQDVKLKFAEVESRKAKSATELQEEPKGLKISKMSALSSESFIADFIEIDKNALLHICDLLGVEPVEGEILRTIIEAIEASNYLTINEYYKEILELFGVDTELNQKTQEILIIEIKNFRSTLMSLVEKVSILEARIDSLSKENHRLSKQINKAEFKQMRAHSISAILDGLNEGVMRTKLGSLNKKYGQVVSQQA